MQGVHLREYGVQTTIDFELYEVDGVDLRVDWVPAAADCEVMKDEGASTQCTNTATDEGSTYSIVLTATEMQAARLVLKIVDAATKVFLDKVIVIETYGHASAMHLNFPSDITHVMGTILTEGGAGRLAAAIIKLFDVASPLLVASDVMRGTDSANTVVPDAAGVAPTAAEIKTAIEAAGSHITLIKAVTDVIPDSGALTTIAADTARLTAARAQAIDDWINGGRLDLILDIIAADTTTDIPALIAALENVSAANVETACDASLATYDAPTKAEMDTAHALLATPAQVNAQVLDVMNVDTFAEPGQGAPAATTSIFAKINYLYKSWRNKKDNDGDTTQLYNDAGAVVDQKQTTSEAAGTVTKTEWITGA